MSVHMEEEAEEKARFSDNRDDCCFVYVIQKRKMGR